MAPDLTQYPANQSSRPYTRWWWLGGPFRQEDIVYQLDWLQTRTASAASSWPGSIRPGRRRAESEHPARVAQRGVVGAGRLRQAVRRPDRARLRLHVRKLLAVRRLAGARRGRRPDPDRPVQPAAVRLLGARASAGPEPPLGAGAASLRRGARSRVRPGLAGSPSALFCDSLELDPDGIWSADLWDQFEARFGYRLEERLELARTHPHMRYEYRRMVGSTMQREFFETFARICRELGADLAGPVPRRADRPAGGVRQRGRPGVGGAAVRAAASRGSRPRRRRWPASTLVSAETFTCIYGSSAPATCARPATGDASRSPT